MKEQVQMTRGELLDLLEDSERIATGAWRWGTAETYVCVRDGKNYKFTVLVHSQEGVQFDGGTVPMIEVKPQKREVIEWVEVESPRAGHDTEKGGTP